jgi:predicted PurR-regulated permease PerM
MKTSKMDIKKIDKWLQERRGLFKGMSSSSLIVSFFCAAVFLISMIAPPLKRFFQERKD